MNVEMKRRLLDALEACRAIQQFSSGVDYNTFLGDEMLQAALERKFEILGEALNRAEQSQPDLADRLPEFAAHRRNAQPDHSWLRCCR